MRQKNDLIGTWKLKRHSSFTENVEGLLLYHPNQSMAVVIQGKYMEDGKAVDATIAYAGTFFLEGDCVVHHPSVSNSQSRIGVPQKRFLKLAGHSLFLYENADHSGLVVQWERAIC